MRVFVAGGTGVMGRLVPQLVARGHQVTAMIPKAILSVQRRPAHVPNSASSSTPELKASPEARIAYRGSSIMPATTSKQTKVLSQRQNKSMVLSLATHSSAESSDQLVGSHTTATNAIRPTRNTATPSVTS